MKTRWLTGLLFAYITLAVMSGCDGKQAAASPACANLGNVTDPTLKADLIKKCPRGGTVFKPSEKKQW